MSPKHKMRLVYAYLPNQLGFSETGKYVLEKKIKPRLREIGLQVLDPFVECAKELDFSQLEKLTLYSDVVKFWNEFNYKIPRINDPLMQKSHCMLPILDGGHAVDDGVASEIGYYAGIKRGPIFALRSDFRLSENVAAMVNPQIIGYIASSGGKLIVGQHATERWFQCIKEWYDLFSATQH
jgi:nucleoside 2-deoxyribosyltransferase